MRVTQHRRAGVPTLLFRFWISGRPLWGPGDNATWLHDATADYRGGPVEKLTRARWRRVAWRWGVAGVPVLFLVTLGRWWALSYLAVACGSAGFVGVRMAVLWWPARDVRREFVFPVWAVVCKLMGERYSRKVAVRAVALPPGFGQDLEQVDAPELTVRLHFPAVPLDDGLKKRVAMAAGERLGMPEPSASWMVKGSRAWVDLSPKKVPPRSLAYGEVRSLVMDASASKPFVGLASGRMPVYADLDNDGPHIGISAGTGAGKSTLLRLVLARRIHAGVGVVACDYKVISHRWLRRIAQTDPHRVIYAIEPEEISEAILAVFAEFSRRREVLKTDPDALEGFREVDLLVEELNSTAAMLRKWWGHERREIIQKAKDNGEPVPYVPVVPPCVDALGVLVQAGRELRIHVDVAAQRLDASILAPKDGGAVRESFSNRFLARYTKKAWTMLADSVPFQAFPGGPTGVWAAVQNGGVTFFRAPFMTDDEAYALAMGGEPPAGPVLGGARLIQPHQQQRLVTIGEAWELVGAQSRAALEKAVQRAELVSAGKRGNAHLYDVRELERLS